MLKQDKNGTCSWNHVDLSSSYGMESIVHGTTRVLHGNHVSLSLAVNHGTVHVTGNNCCLTVLRNLGTIIFTGNHGHLNVANRPSASAPASDDSTEGSSGRGHIFTTGNDLQCVVGSSNTVQRLNFVGNNGVLHLPSSSLALNGSVHLRINKEGRAKMCSTPSESGLKQSHKKPTPASCCATSNPSKCSLWIQGRNNVNINFELTRKHFGVA